MKAQVLFYEALRIYYFSGPGWKRGGLSTLINSVYILSIKESSFSVIFKNLLIKFLGCWPSLSKLLSPIKCIWLGCFHFSLFVWPVILNSYLKYKVVISACRNVWVYWGATTSALIPFALWPFALVPFDLLTICSIAHRSRRLLYMSSALFVN